MINNPQNLVASLGVREGAIVADFGAGSGHYAYALSRAVGPSGKVFAVDIQKSLIERLKKDAEGKGIKNIEIIWGDIEVVSGTKLRAASIDTLVVSNVLFQVDAKAGLVHECARVMKPGGVLMLVDWSESFAGLGPEPNTVVSADMARRIFETGPFVYRRELSAGEHHYAMTFERTSV